MASRVADILKAAGQQQAEGLRAQAQPWANMAGQVGQIGNKYGQLAGGTTPPATTPGGDTGVQETSGTPPPTEASPGIPSRNADPALTDAFKLLGTHKGSMEDLLADPTAYPHLSTALHAIKQDPKTLQALAGIGIGPDKIQQFEQELTQRMATRGGQGAPSWLSGAL